MKYGRDVHSYIVGTERKGNKKERKKNIEPAAKKKSSMYKIVGKEGALASHVLGTNRFMPARSPPSPTPQKKLHGGVRVTIPRIIRSAIASQGSGVGIITMMGLCRAVHVASQACDGNIVFLRYSPNPVK